MRHIIGILVIGSLLSSCDYREAVTGNRRGMDYITRDDIRFIRSTDCNTIRLPFHYKLFTDEDYMGRSANHDGFERIDSIVAWCRAEGLYLILDMHDAPGGQTGDNIDDSYGYPWLLVSERSQQLFCDIWSLDLCAAMEDRDQGLDQRVAWVVIP